MGTNNENTENTDATKVQFGIRFEPQLFEIVSDLAVKEDRSIANMIHKLLKQSPQVAELLEAETAGASA